MVCPNCGQEFEGNQCKNCGTSIAKKKKKPAYKKWWFWMLMGLATIVTVAMISNGGSTDSPSGAGISDGSNSSVEIVYEKVDLQTILDELDENALRAKETYQNKHVEFTGKIVTIDSAGKYISVEPELADTWNFDTISCDLMSAEHRAFVASKKQGDVITVRGEITSVGEVLGYRLDVISLG